MTLDHFMTPVQPIASSPSPAVVSVEVEDVDDTEEPDDVISTADESSKPTIHQGITNVRLSSVLSLRKALEDNEHSGITALFQEHIFVGVVDERRALIQFQTKLLMINFFKLRYLICLILETQSKAYT